MSAQLIASFKTQFAAMSAVDKLLACGMNREHVTVKVEQSAGKSAASATSSTSVISSVSDQGQPATEGQSQPRYPSKLPDPAAFGHAEITIDLGGKLPAEEVRHILMSASALSIRNAQKKSTHEDPRVWPEGGHGSNVDVDRAVEAARHGSSLNRLK